MKNLGFLGFDKYSACSTGRIYSIRSGRYLRETQQPTGYLFVCLSQDGIKQSFSVHRLVALAYIPQVNPEAIQVNHKNGLKTDNSLSNLEWMTAQENSQHAVLTGLRGFYKNKDRELTDEDAHKVCQLIADSWRNKDIASLMNIDQQRVASIRYGDTYQEISDEYDFSNTLPSRRKMSVEKLVHICEMLQSGESYNSIRSKLKVSTASISKIKNRKVGLYISKSYEF